MSKNQTSTANEPLSLFLSDGGADLKDKLAQGSAVDDAAKKPAGRSRHADLRLHFGSYFVRIIAGKERRSPERLKQDRKENPAFTLSNLPLIIAIWLFSAAALLFFLRRTLEIFAQMSSGI